MIIYDGCALVCSDKLAMRRVEKGKERNTSSFGKKEFQQWQRHPEIFKKYASQRVFQNK